MQNENRIPDYSQSLAERFKGLSDRCLSPGVAFDACHANREILQHYAMPDRRYHNLNHLRQCLEQFDLARQLIPTPDVVEMALWFHDVIYVPGASDNESRSAEFFLDLVSSVFPTEFCHKVVTLILATTHKVIPTDLDACYTVDIDLSSFGFEWQDFLIDSDHLRQERMDLPDVAYFEAHTRFLNILRARQRIFQTDFFYQRYEKIAANNIDRLLLKRKHEGYN